MGESRFSAEAPRNPFPPHLRGPGEAKTGNKQGEKGIGAGNIFSKRKDIFSQRKGDIYMAFQTPFKGALQFVLIQSLRRIFLTWTYKLEAS